MMNASSLPLSGWCYRRCLLPQGGGLVVPGARMAILPTSCNSCRCSSGMLASSTGPPASARVWSRPRRRSCTVTVFNPQGTVDFPMEDEEVSPEIPVAPPATEGRIDIIVTKEAIRNLDLSPAHAVLRKYVHQIGDNTTAPPEDPKELLHRTIGFVLDYERDNQFDPRELSEMPDIRLWFVRLDAAYPWLPVVLDWRGGELARYAAMLVPHQMSKRMGLVFNPEALELFSMNKLFVVYNWLKCRQIGKPAVKANDMMKMLGFRIEDQLFNLLETYPYP